MGSGGLPVPPPRIWHVAGVCRTCLADYPRGSLVRPSRSERAPRDRRMTRPDRGLPKVVLTERGREQEESRWFRSFGFCDDMFFPAGLCRPPGPVEAQTWWGLKR